MIRATADTNICVSALIFPRGKPFEFLELAREGKISLSVSEAILDELGDVLARKFGWPPEEIQYARRRIAAIPRTVTPPARLSIIKEDPPDNRILECASAAGSDYTVTGYKDLLRLGQYDSIRIVTVADFLNLHQGQERKR